VISRKICANLSVSGRLRPIQKFFTSDEDLSRSLRLAREPEVDGPPLEVTISFPA